jgi:hypothetical protein
MSADSEKILSDKLKTGSAVSDPGVDAASKRVMQPTDWPPNL